MADEYPFQLEVKVGRLEYNDTAFRHVKTSKSYTKVPLRNVLWAAVETTEDKKKKVVVSVLAPSSGKLQLVEVAVELKGEKGGVLAAEQWVKSLLDLSYEGIKRRRNLRILINPVGGKGRAVSTYEREVERIFATANCTVDMTISESHGHMMKLSEDMDLNYDAIVVLSGDGGLHEVVNGLAKHPEAHKALRIPLAQIPTGSANALCCNHFGPKDAFDVGMACLNVVKGKPMKHNVYSITQGEKHYLSFLTQAAGLMADLDLGTEHLRWMGDGRFILGYLRGVISKKICPIEVEYKLVEGDKAAMVATLKKKTNETHFHEEEVVESEEPQPLPWLTGDKPLDTEGWTKFEKPIIYLYAGGLPYVARDLMQFPMANPSDGCIDLVIQSVATRGTMIKATVGSEKGEQFSVDSQNYFKVSAYRVKPTGKGNFSVDGEFYPLEPFEMQVHADIIRFLSLDGRYNVDAFNTDLAVLKT